MLTKNSTIKQKFSKETKKNSNKEFEKRNERKVIILKDYLCYID